MKTTISSKGQITVPVKIRRKLGLEPGMTLEFDEDSDFLLARPSFDETEMDGVFGCAKPFEPEKSSAEVLKDQRGYDRDTL
jgi:AbrB family looped-hinge helix DNA binding protein